MIWGGMLVRHNGETDLVTVNGRLNARRYCDEIIIPVVILVLQRGRADILQQNNARCHAVRHTMFNVFTAEQHLNTRLVVAFVEHNATMSSIRYFENHASYFVQNRRKQTLLNSFLYDK